MSTSNTATIITVTFTAVQNVQYCIILTPILNVAQPWANGTDITICRPATPLAVTSLEEATQYQIVAYLVGPQLQRSGQTSPVIVITNHAGWCTMCMCKRGFGSPRIWIPHPKTLADLDDPKRGFGSPADLDPSIYFVYDRLENDDVECWEPNPRTPKRGFGSPADLDPDSQRIVEDLFRQVSMSLAHSD